MSVGGVAMHPVHGPWPEKYAGIDGESVGGFVGRSTGALGFWLKSKSAAMFPSSGSSSRTSGRGSGRPSVLGFSLAPSRKSSSMNFR